LAKGAEAAYKAWLGFYNGQKRRTTDGTSEQVRAKSYRARSDQRFFASERTGRRAAFEAGSTSACVPLLGVGAVELFF
jgi:hypothetical protein